MAQKVEEMISESSMGHSSFARRHRVISSRRHTTCFYRTVFFTPYVIPLVGSGLVFTLLFNTDNGLVNHVLTHFGMKPVNWLGSSHTALISVMLVSLWQYCGYYMLIFLAGLQNVPQSLVEACQVDGANRWRKMVSEWSMMTGYLPVQKATLQQSDYQAFLKKNSQFNTALAELKYQKAAPASPQYLGVLQTVQQGLQGIFDEGKSVTQTMQQTAQQADSELNG
ncbi:ABC transporter permease subunit [Alicyclobacillus fastidiosus]|uniref:ABC transporter permease subunit n=1 Tax=Alicyclobacillus fastidiosus TaxID=392011 RepID=A0ABY6ZIM7_9BACL|nr:ABC transporter permease subunit [Alicyclobacillus fastidiosus]WAH42066.1 ABC transporter permease subunit [Alicyclobacillus fastidiosus]